METKTASDLHLSRFAHVIERIGLAITGALCGLFVAAVVSKANIEEVNSLGVLFSVLVYSSAGFYLGINIPAFSPAARSAVSDTNSSRATHPIALASAIGTLLAAVTALVSVYLIVFDEALPLVWTIAIGFGWMLGVLLQLAAGTVARLGLLTDKSGW